MKHVVKKTKRKVPYRALRFGFNSNLLCVGQRGNEIVEQNKLKRMLRVKGGIGGF